MKFFSVAGVLTLIASTTVASAIDWFRWRGPDLNGISKETGWQVQWPSPGPKQLWKASVGTGFASVSVSNGRVYTTGNTRDTDTVFCFEAGSGKMVWKYSYSCPLDAKYFEGGTGATPTVDGDRVYTFSRRGHVFCLGAADGKVIWSKNVTSDLGAEMPTWGFASSPLIQGDLLILNAGGAGAAFDKKTGKPVWDSGKAAAGYATAVPLGASQPGAIGIFGGQALVAVKVADGRELWRYPWKTEYDVNAADPIIDGDRVFVSSGYNHGGTVVKISGGQPQKVWENKNMRNHFNSCVLWQQYLYGPDEGELRCLSFDTGEVKWKYPAFGKGSLMMADGKLIGMSEKGELIIAEVDPAAFKPISRAQVLSGKCWTTPVLSNGRIYCRNAAGQVVCVDVSGRQTAGR
jgi:outer membrane protein assembly factor BamB